MVDGFNRFKNSHKTLLTHFIPIPSNPFRAPFRGVLHFSEAHTIMSNAKGTRSTTRHVLDYKKQSLVDAWVRTHYKEP